MCGGRKRPGSRRESTPTRRDGETASKQLPILVQARVAFRDVIPLKVIELGLVLRGVVVAEAQHPVAQGAVFLGVYDRESVVATLAATVTQPVEVCERITHHCCSHDAAPVSLRRRVPDELHSNISRTIRPKLT